MTDLDFPFAVGELVEVHIQSVDGSDWVAARVVQVISPAEFQRFIAPDIKITGNAAIVKLDGSEDHWFAQVDDIRSRFMPDRQDVEEVERWLHGSA